jgi:hypothetical protein
LYYISKFLAFRYDAIWFYSEGPTHLCETYAVYITLNSYYRYGQKCFKSDCKRLLRLFYIFRIMKPSLILAGNPSIKTHLIVVYLSSSRWMLERYLKRASTASFRKNFFKTTAQFRLPSSRVTTPNERAPSDGHIHYNSRPVRLYNLLLVYLENEPNFVTLITAYVITSPRSPQTVTEWLICKN